MEDLRTLQHNDPFRSPFGQQGEPARKEPQREPEDWEDWEDNDEPTTPTTADEPLVAITTTESPRSKHKRKPSQTSESRSAPAPRYSVQKPSRLKSRKRQQAQNAKAGIKLVTDMTRYRKEQQHIVQAMRPEGQAGDRRTGKFVDAAALRALEGSPNDGSVGNWAWLKRKPTNKKKQQKAAKSNPRQEDLSPADRPIVIGITLPEDDLVGRTISPQTATVETPLDLSKHIPKKAPTLVTQDPNRSVWSPDTEDGSPFQSRAASSLPSAGASSPRNVPPMPAMPFAFKSNLRSPVADDEDDAGTPITLFEEDGSPVYTRKSFKAKGHARSPATTITRSGWWDHVQTPFVPSPVSPFTAKPASPAAAQTQDNDEWWKTTNTNEKKKPSPPSQGLSIATASSSQAPAERSPTVASSSRAPPAQPEPQTQTISEKARILAEENESEKPVDLPPPYEAAAAKQEQVRYHAVFPPGHPFQGQASNTTRPASPGLAHTMTSQGANSMTDVPLTPAHLRAERTGTTLPDRPAGTYLPSAYLDRPVGESPAAKTERQRRRHEKEDAIARRIEGFWKGRGCMPSNGCYGRRGREGRQRRRIILGVIIAAIALIILAVVLGVTLTRKAVTAAAPLAAESEYSFWLNLTNYPPVPTGVTTVIGADNKEMNTQCVDVRTVWSCALGPDARDNLPYKPENPNFFIQIQYDNNTRQLWNVPDGPIPTPTGKAKIEPTPSATPTAQPSNDGQGRMIDKNNTREGVDSSLEKPKEQDKGGGGINPIGRRAASKTVPTLFDPGFNPNPAPPAFEEMYFLGNTTDNIVSDRKAGEPTPFYISFLPNINAIVGPNVPGLAKRGLVTGPDWNISKDLPAPELNPDGSPAKGILHPYPVQQPLRLYDRGLPTEHLGFYTFFNKTIYVKHANASDNPDTFIEDENGGVAIRDANYVVTIAQTRFKVQIWTRMSNDTLFIGGGARGNTTQPGTFPYPITLTEDNHGGAPRSKGIYTREIENGKIMVEQADLLRLGFDKGGTLINGYETSKEFDDSWGGIDGGTSGCKCQWQNFLSG